MNGFYERLIDELKYQDISLATLAKGIDIADSTVRNFKKNVIPKADLAVKIADFLKVSVSWLITGEGSRTVMSRNMFVTVKNSPIDAREGLF